VVFWGILLFCIPLFVLADKWQKSVSKKSIKDDFLA